MAALAGAGLGTESAQAQDFHLRGDTGVLSQSTGDFSWGARALNFTEETAARPSGSRRLSPHDSIETRTEERKMLRTILKVAAGGLVVAAIGGVSYAAVPSQTAR